MTSSSSTSESVLDLIGWLFGFFVAAIGIVNTFWGNDPGFGVFLILLAFVYFPPVNLFFQHLTGFALPRIAKWVLAVLIIVAALGVGELFAKIDLMLQSF